MTDAERLPRLESMQLSNEKNISVLASAVKHTKEALERMDKTQAEVSATLKVMSRIHRPSTIHLVKRWTTSKQLLKNKIDMGSPREQSLDKRVGEIRELLSTSISKSWEALITAALAFILK